MADPFGGNIFNPKTTASEVTTLDLLGSIRRAQERVGQYMKVKIGQAPSLLSRISSWINRDLFAIAGSVKAAQEGKPIGKAFVAGLKGKEASFEEVLAKAGMGKGFARSATGLGLDVAASPISWLVAAIEPSPLGEAAMVTSKAIKIKNLLGIVTGATKKAEEAGLVSKTIKGVQKLVPAIPALGKTVTKGELPELFLMRKAMQTAKAKGFRLPAGLGKVYGETVKEVGEMLGKEAIERVVQAAKPTADLIFKIKPPFPLSTRFPGVTVFKSREIGTLATRIGKTVGGLPVINLFGKGFIPGYHTPGQFQDLRMLVLGEKRGGLNEMQNKIAGLFKVYNSKERSLASVAAVRGWDIDLFKQLGFDVSDLTDKKTIGRILGLKDSVRDIMEEQFSIEKQLRIPMKYVEEYLPIRDLIKTGDTADYLRQIVRQGLPGFTKDRKFKDVVEAILEGNKKVELDIGKLLYYRTAAHLQAVSRWEMMREAAAQFGIPATAGRAALERAQKELPKLSKLVEYPVTPALKGRWFFEDSVATALRKFEEFYVNEPTTKDFLNALDVGIRTWKGYATATPGFHGRNFLSDVWQHYLNDVARPKNYRIAMSAMRNKGEVGGKVGNIPIKEIWNWGKAHGVEGAGFMGKEISPEIRKVIEGLPKWSGEYTPILLKKLTGKTIPIPSIIEASRALGVPRENYARWVQFFGSVAKNANLKLPKEQLLQKALHDVVRFHFDYGDLTPIEQNFMKRIVPFYTWARKNIPLQFAQLIQEPGKFATIGKVKMALERASTPLTSEQREFLPKWIEELYGMQVPTKVAEVMLKPTDALAQLFGGTSVKKGTPYFLNPNLAFQDINRAFDLWDLMSTMNPMIKTPIEVISNRSFFLRGKAIEPYPNAVRPAPYWLTKLPNKMKEVFGMRKVQDKWVISNLSYKVIQDFNPLLATIGRSWDLGNENQASNMLSAMIGIKFIPYTEPRMRGEMWEKKRELTDLQRYLKAVGVMPKE